MLTFLIIYMLITLLYAVIIVRFSIGLKHLPTQSRILHHWPSVSIVVAVKNESLNIQNLLQSFAALDYPNDLLEVIIVDDHSSDDSLKVLEQFNDFSIRVIRNKGVGKKRAIETGVSLAQGSWIAVTDGDCIVPKSWLKSMFQYSLPSHKLILGPVGINKDKSDFLNLQSIEFSALQGATAGAVGFGYPISANGANMLFDKKTFSELKPYAHNYHIPSGDDQFLLLAMMNAYPDAIGYALNDGAAIKTNPVSSIAHYISQRTRWASKAGAISSKRIQFTGFIIFFMSFMVIAALLYGVYTKNYLWVLLAIIPKCIIDLWVILPMKRVLKFNGNVGQYLAACVIYPVVVVLTVVKGLFKSYGVR